jgi:cupin fold WbuC family metalloprotein
MMKVFSVEYINNLIAGAQRNPRKRQHKSIHESYEDPCQRLFNAIEPESYIRPHKHATDPKDELLIAVHGLMVLVIFDEQGIVIDTVRFGAGKVSEGVSVGVEVPCNAWHTVIALEPRSVLLEVKSGPFDPNRPKDLAPWAPDEGTLEARDYLNELIERVF